MLVGDDFCECTAHSSYYTQIYYTTGHMVTRYTCFAALECHIAHASWLCGMEIVKGKKAACCLQGRMDSGGGQGLCL